MSNSLLRDITRRSRDPLTGLVAPRIGATLRAMERAGVIRTLAEPNLTAISGETAHFHRRRRISVSRLSWIHRCRRLANRPIEFKKFGVGLIFTPVVLSEGRISLKVMTEVSDLSTENASCAGHGTTSPLARRSRPAAPKPLVEIPSGGSLAMAGMIQEQTKTIDQRIARR